MAHFKLHFPSIVRERVERLEQMIAERNSVVEATQQQELATPTSATPLEHLSGHTYTPLSGTPFKKNKIKNCEY